jgi:hypothetical protein
VVGKETQVKLENVRINFYKGQLWVAQQYQGQHGEPPSGKFKYAAQFLIVPGSDNDKKIRAAYELAAKAAWGEKKWKEIWDECWGRPKECAYINGDRSEKDGFQGMMVLSGKRDKESQGPILVIDRAKNPETGKFFELTKEDFRPYPGCYVNALVDLWCQPKPNAGIRCTIMTVQFVKDGDAFGGARPSEDAFEEVVDEEASDLV